MNYFVPNFGSDGVINQSFDSLAWAEKNQGHKWVVDPNWKKKKGPPQNYFVPNFGVDEDIKIAQANIADSEKKLKHTWKPVQDDNGVWMLPEANKWNMVQLDSEINVESDPVCSSAGCNYNSDKGKTPYPMNYKVPNFGRDKDINVTWNSLDW